jgi:hypothetical protein
MMLKSRFRNGILATLAVGAMVFGSTSPALAVSGTVGGELNCNGNNVYYNTTRFTVGSSTRIQYRLSNTAGSQYGLDITYLGVHLVTSGAYIGQHGMTIQSPDAVLSPYYINHTGFTLYGHMPASDGTCDNVFSGTLYY